MSYIYKTCPTCRATRTIAVGIEKPLGAIEVKCDCGAVLVQFRPPSEQARDGSFIRDVSLAK